MVNCTRHGGWTDWTEWSACSAQCGPGFQHRSRTCSNPQPAFGGHDCIGTALEERGCPDNPICHPSVAVQIPKEVTHWNEWGEWSACSSPCGGGFQVRRRQCGTAMRTRECDLGCSKEYRSCNNHECPEVKSAPEWGEWHIVSPVSTTIVAGGSQRENRNGSLSTNPSTSAVGWLARRFRYQCIARVPYATSIRLVFSKNERSCQNHVDCYTSWAAHQETSENGSLWSTWSAWSPCSVSCGGGVQRRERVCNNRGHGNSGCSGLSVQEQQCNQEPCPIEGWSEWTPWSRCDNLSGEQQRKRQCIAKEQWRCLANVHTRESRSCLNDENVIASASIESQCVGVGLLTFTMAVILAYVSGLATIVLVVRTYNKRHQEEVLISGASGSLCNSIQGIHVPKHLASQPLVQAESNTYVPSSAFKGQFDVLNSQTASPVKVTATIKRSSTFRAQIEDDQNF